MRWVLLTSALTCSMLGPAYAGFGGGDNFDSNATAEFSDYGGRSGYGNTASSRGSSCQCNDSYSIDQLGSRIGSYGANNQRYDIYSRDSMTGQETLVNTSWDGGFRVDTYQSRDETTNRTITRTVRTAAKPESKPITRVDMLVAPEPAMEQSPPPSPVPPTELPAKLADQEPEQVREALDYMKRHVVDRIGPPTKSEKALAQAMGISVGAVTGWFGGGIGKSDHVLSKRVTGMLLGAGMGAKTKATFMEGAARNLMTLSPDEMRDIERVIEKMNSEQQDRLTNTMRDAIREQRIVERKQADRNHKANEGGKSADKSGGGKRK